MVKAKKNECANVLKEVKGPCKDFSFTDGMLKGSLAEDKKPKSGIWNDKHKPSWKPDEKSSISRLRSNPNKADWCSSL